MKVKKLLFLFCFTVMVYLYFYNAQHISIAVKEGLYLCCEVVIPSLYIFMVVSSFISQLKCAEYLSAPFGFLFRLLNINNRKIVSYCILSVIGGFAAGGVFLNKIHDEFCCDKNLLNILPIICTCNSPAFVICAVGGQLLNSINAGILLYCSMLLSAFVTAFIFSFITPYIAVQNTKNDVCSNIDISRAIKESVMGIIYICGSVILAYTICKVISLNIKNPFISAVFSVLCEVTTACTVITDSFGAKLYLLCIALCFTPLSTYFQLKSLCGSKYSFKTLYISKLVQIPVSLLILRLLIHLFPSAVLVYSSNDFKVSLYRNSPHISLYLLLLSVCFIVSFDKKLGYLRK